MMRLSVALSTLAFSLAFALSPPALAETEFAGDIAPRDEGRFMTVGDAAALDIDPAVIVKGDRLMVYTKAKPGARGRNGGRGLIPAGELVVTSASSEAPTGRLAAASREILDGARLAFVLDRDEQVNIFLPFLQSMADTFLGDPGGGPLRVVPLDMTDPYGDRTRATDAVFEKLEKHLCLRPQFDCSGSAGLSEELFRIGVNTSRSLDDAALERLGGRLGADVFVMGRMRVEEDGALDLVLAARNAGQKNKTRQVWRRFRLFPGAVGLQAESLDEITVRHRERKTGRLRLALSRVDSVEGMRAEYFSYMDAESLARSAGARVEDIHASGFYARLNGAYLRMSPDGVFLDGPVPAGTARVTFGYYPTVEKDGGIEERALRPFEKTMKINVAEGGETTVGLVGKIEGRYAVIVADVSR
ncbi:MAG: hypothetical protein ACNS63_08275 [Candidatus Nitrospinota bacterium M3_3B_026]